MYILRARHASLVMHRPWVVVREHAWARPAFVRPLMRRTNVTALASTPPWSHVRADTRSRVVRFRGGMALAAPRRHLRTGSPRLLKGVHVRHAHSRAAFALAAGLIALLAVAGCRSTGGGAPSGQRSEAFVR